MQNCILLLRCRTRRALRCDAMPKSEAEYTEKKGRFLLSLSLSYSCFHSLAVCVCVFWSNVKCDARGNAQILSFINWNVRKSWVRPAHDWQAGKQIRSEYAKEQEEQEE